MFAHIIMPNTAFPDGPGAHSTMPWSIISSYCRKNPGLTGSQCSLYCQRSGSMGSYGPSHRWIRQLNTAVTSGQGQTILTGSYPSDF